METNNKEWDGYKSVRDLSANEKDELKCYYFDTNVVEEYSDEELYEVADDVRYTYEDFLCNCA